MAAATAEDRTLLTFDKDFGELAFRVGLPASSGVIQFRTGVLSPEESAGIALATLRTAVNWTGHFCVVDERRLRVTRLPTSPALEKRFSLTDSA
jgi:predicted nuclease of predicted toxin-antitoxin system